VRQAGRGTAVHGTCKLCLEPPQLRGCSPRHTGVFCERQHGEQLLGICQKVCWYGREAVACINFFATLCTYVLPCGTSSKAADCEFI
jgi:hypothetical protein